MMTVADEVLITESLEESPERTDMDKQGREYRYQADWSIGNRMFHVRTDSWEEFVSDCGLMETMFPKQGFPEDAPGTRVAQPQPQGGNIPICGVHGTPMVLKPAGVSKTGRAYPAFWSCTTKNADGTYCSFKPPKQ